jgi:hypothetical protein
MHNQKLKEFQKNIAIAVDILESNPSNSILGNEDNLNKFHAKVEEHVTKMFKDMVDAFNGDIASTVLTGGIFPHLLETWIDHKFGDALPEYNIEFNKDVFNHICNWIKDHPQSYTIKDKNHPFCGHSIKMYSDLRYNSLIDDNRGQRVVKIVLGPLVKKSCIIQ